MKIYHHKKCRFVGWLPKITTPEGLKVKPNAITLCFPGLGNHIFFREQFPPIDLINHERAHVPQWKRYWYIGFPFVYVYQWIRYGFKHNKMPLEIEAFEESGTF